MNPEVYSASSSVTNQIWFHNQDVLCKFFPIVSPMLEPDYLSGTGIARFRVSFLDKPEKHFSYKSSSLFCVIINHKPKIVS